MTVRALVTWLPGRIGRGVGTSLAVITLVLGTSGVAVAAPVTHDDVLDSVACTRPASCTTVGTSTAGVTLAEGWSGSAWKVQPTPNPKGLTGSLLGVSCPSSASCMAVGEMFDSDGFGRPVVEQRSRSRWHLASSALPLRAGYAGLEDVSCWKAGQCMAVGLYARGRGASLPMAELWNGTRFRAMALPIARGDSGYQTGITCRSGKSCIAVGNFSLSSGTESPASYTWNGKQWRSVEVPAPKSVLDSGLNDVSCPAAGTCYAVGTYIGRGVRAAFAELWRAGAWHLVKLPVLAGTHDQRLLGIDCASTAQCVAVGGAADTRGNNVPLVEVLARGRWHVQAAPQPGRDQFAGLSDVSCARVSACVAVGDSTGPDGFLTLAEGWNGSVWRVLQTSSP
jgi:hypothetical protein